MDRRFDDIDRLGIDTIRTLSMDAVERANSGHPGTPMALAPVIYALYTRLLRHNPANPGWPDRDRFVLSCGHASMLLYSILHLTGYDLDVGDLEAFRQWGSRTPGHPEWHEVPGVEVTTGPLGQGCGASVGMAVAEAHLAARFNRPGHRVVDHMTWVLCSDGDLMEGVASEAASLAGHLGLGKLVWIWDDNRITIEGPTELAFSENVVERFAAYGWQTITVADANDVDGVLAALIEAKTDTARPSLVAVRSHIAWGAPAKQDTADAHGAPLGADEVRAAKQRYGWPSDAEFLVPTEVLERCRSDRGGHREAEWSRTVAAWREAHPGLAGEFDRRLERRLPTTWSDRLPAFAADAKGVATRSASGKVLNSIAADLPELVGGSADLAPSCKTLIGASGDLTATSPGERNLRFGVREHGMAAVLNGLSLHGGLRPYGSTFLVFSDYMRPAIRLAALMRQPVIYVFTHDSVWVGEDGPTHQPVEHLAALRTIPNLVVIRPADANETAAAWRCAVARTDGPTALVLTRQSVPVLDGTGVPCAAGVRRGGYVVAGADDGRVDLVLIATGSEVQLALAARHVLADHDLAVRVVSMPSWELLEEQPAEVRRELLPAGVPRLAIEAGIAMGWRRWVGDDGAVVSIERFGASAPGRVVAERLGLTTDALISRALGLLGRA